MDSTAPNFKKIGFFTFAFLIFFIPLYFFGISLTKPGAIESLKTKLSLFEERPRVIQQESKQISSKEESEEEGPVLYYLDLEYDPTTSKLAKIGSGYSHGHLSSLKPEPSTSEETINFRMEEISPSNQVTSNGWISRYKDAISKTDGKYRFRASADYVPGGKISIYSINNQNLLEEIIN